MEYGTWPVLSTESLRGNVSLASDAPALLERCLLHLQFVDPFVHLCKLVINHNTTSMWSKRVPTTTLWRVVPRVKNRSRASSGVMTGALDR